MKWMFKNSSNKPDAMLTLSVIGFFVVILKLLFAGNSIVIEGSSYSFGQLSASEIAAILTPTLSAYIARRHTDKKWTNVTRVVKVEEDE